MLPAVLHSDVPLYRLSLGTENLFAREFGRDRSLSTLTRAFEASSVVEVDAAMLVLAAGSQPVRSPFLLMCSVGPDAGRLPAGPIFCQS